MFGEDFNVHATDAELLGIVVALVFVDLAVFRIWVWIGWDWIVVIAWFVNHDGLAVEVVVRKELSRIFEVHHGEVKLVMLFLDARATADDLLEGGHGLDVLIKHDELAGLGVDSCGQQLGGGGDHGELALGIDEVV